MHAASVPVSFRKEGSDVVNKLLRNLSAVSLDAPAGRDPEGAALGDTLRLEDTELGDPADPGTLDARATIVDAITAASADIPAEVLDLVLAALDGQAVPFENRGGYPLEDGLDAPLLLAAAHQLGIGPTSQQQAQRIDEDRLAGPRLSA
jgi:hypothetical protein